MASKADWWGEHHFERCLNPRCEHVLYKNYLAWLRIMRALRALHDPCDTRGRFYHYINGSLYCKDCYRASFE
jgi:hypothetical protein